MKPLRGIIPARRSAGNVKSLVHTLPIYPKSGLVIYYRPSGRKAGNPRKADVKMKTQVLVEEVRQLAPDRKILGVFSGVENSKLTSRRRVLVAAATETAKRRGILVTADLSRFVRPAAYDRWKNPDAWPTPEEFALLAQLTRGVPLATVADPTLSESERHRLAILRSKRAGRPRSISPELAEAIFAELGALFFTRTGHPRWERSLAKVAKAFGVSPQAIVREMAKISPAGVTWREAALRTSGDAGRRVRGRR